MSNSYYYPMVLLASSLYTQKVGQRQPVEDSGIALFENC